VLKAEDPVQCQSLYFPPLSGTTWDTLSPLTLGWCTTEIDTLYDYLSATNTKGFMILKDGKIVLEKYFGSFTVDSLWYWASAGKSLTAFLTGIAQQEGYLSIADTTSDYLGAGWTVCPPLKEEKIQIVHQLTMTTGLDDGVADIYCTIDTCLQYLTDAGTRWAYHTAPYTLLDTVIQSATGLGINAWFFQKLGQPTGMVGLYIPSGFNNLFISTARTMARFGLLMLNNGNWNGNQIMTDSVYFNQMVNTSQSLNQSYGYLWWLNGKPSFMVPGIQFAFPGSFCPDAPSDMIGALGKNGQILNVIPSQNMIVVRLGDAPGTGEVPFTYTDSVWVYLNRVLCSATSTVENPNSVEFKVSPNPATETIFVHSGDMIYAEIISSDGTVVSVFKGQHELNIAALKSGMYYLRGVGARHVYVSKFFKE